MSIKRAIIACFFVIVPIAAARADTPLPRYVLPIGRQLTYSFSSESKSVTDTNAFSTSGSIQVTVMRENPDGSRRIVVRKTSVWKQIIAGHDHAQPEETSLSYADIFPDGRIEHPEKQGMESAAASVLPPLPADAQQIANGWKDDQPQRLLQFNCTALPATAGEFIFRSDQAGLFNKLYSTTGQTTFHFDLGKGAISLDEGTTSQDFGFHTKGASSLRLEPESMLSAADVAQQADDYDLLFAAKDQSEAKLAAVETDPDQVDALIADAQSILRQAQTKAKSDAVKMQLARMLKDNDDEAKDLKEDIGHAKRLLNKPAADWSAKTIDGKPVKLTDYKGKIILMDFWYRGCGWCMYAMPQIKQVAQDFKDKPVVVLGMNTDQNEKDARFVIDAMALNYPTIRAMNVPGQYGIHAFPTLLIIDADGIVRRIHVGYSATLRADLSKTITGLLDRSKK